MYLSLIDKQALWQQLDGPQANSLINGGRKWLKSWSMDHMRYFRNLNLDNAVGKHLDFLGTIVGISRPLITSEFYVDQAFKFWNTPTAENNPTGFSAKPSTYIPKDSTAAVTDGGVFDFAAPSLRPEPQNRDMTDDEYRAFLEIIVKMSHPIGSYLFVDDICHAYAGLNYSISAAYGTVASAKIADILITITVYDTSAFARIDSVMQTYVSPFPQVFMDMVANVN